MNAFNFLSHFVDYTDVNIYEHKGKYTDHSKPLFRGKVRDLVTSESLCWNVLNCVIVSGCLMMYVEVVE